MKLPRRRRRIGKRLKVVTLAGGLALLLGVVPSIVFASEPDDGGRGVPSANGLYAPKLDPKGTRKNAEKYLISRGVPRDKATLRMQKQTGQIRAATKLRKQAPDSVPSVWIDDNGTLKAAVLNETGERAARDAGATPQRVTFAEKDLKKIRDTLSKDAKDNPPPGLSGASFAIDPVKGKVIAEYLFEDSAKPVVPKVANQFGDKVVASAKHGTLKPYSDVDISGSPMARDVGGGNVQRCTAAWAVDIANPKGGAPTNGVMTAGHCFDTSKDPARTEYDIDTIAAGNTQAKGEFATVGPAGDYGYLRLERDRGTTVMANSRNVVEAIEEPVKGATVCKDGAKSGETCGQIERVDVSVLHETNGTNFLLKGMTTANFCAQHGDSGAPVYADFDKAKSPRGIAAIGIFSSASVRRSDGACKSHVTPLSNIDPQGKFFVRIDGG